LLILMLLATGKAGRARAGVLDRARDEARATGSDHDESDSHDDASRGGGKLERVRKETREERDRQDDDHDHGHGRRRRRGGDAVFTGFWFSSHHHHSPPQPCVTEVYTTSGLPPEEY